MTKVSDRRKKIQKEAAKKRPQTWKPGQSGNPKGNIKRGESWQEIYKKIGNMTPKEAADYCHSVAGKIASIGDNVTLKEAVVLRVFVALLFDPDARLLNVVQVREEGNVVQPVTEMPWREYVKQMGYDPDTLMHEAEEIVNRRFTELGGRADNSRGDRVEVQSAGQVA